MRGEFISDYQKLNSEDQKAVRRWLLANAVVGAILLAGLIALTSFSGNESGATAQNATMHRQAKLPWAIMTWSHRNLAEPIPPEAIYPPQNGIGVVQ